MPRVAVIGAGLSGLICARTLSDHGFDVTVFEKSRGVGGRMSTRRVEDVGSFDHGAQYFTVRDERFRRYVQSWVDDQVVELWAGKIAVLGRSESENQKAEKQSPERFVARPGMNQIGKHLASDLQIRFQMRVGAINRLRDGWSVVDESGSELGQFDTVVVSAPAGQAVDLLKEAPSLAEVAAACQMQPSWAVMLAVKDSIPVEFDGAFVHNSPLSWIARNSSKPGRTRDPEKWVLHANVEWTRGQESTDRETVATALIEEFARATGVLSSQIFPVYSTAHFWRYAIPSSPLDQKCLFDDALSIGACGDWCGGPRVEGAFLSGSALAGRVMGHWNDRWQVAGAVSPDEPTGHQLKLF